VAKRSGDASVAQYGDAVADARDLIEFGRDEQHGHPVGGQIADQLLDLGLGADIDAAGGLVEDEQRGWVISQRASSTFCWLPPLRFLMGVSGSRGRMSSISI
jgi:hypothetical protein